MRDDERLPPDLQRAVEVLREPLPVRAEWIESVAAKAAADRVAAVRPEGAAGRWSVHPLVALAAGIACLVVGAAGMYVALERPNAGTSSQTVSRTASAIATAPVRFALIAPGAATVQLVGDFNAWNPVALPMRRTGDGSTWEVEVGLPPGRYTYAFVVDGRLARDPSAAQAPGDDFGVPNSVLLVKGGGA
jgi:Carbohydrate-binding module 48 (Isoamylase N-terminal domain)